MRTQRQRPSFPRRESTRQTSPRKQPDSAVVSTELVRYSTRNKTEQASDVLAAEEPLEIRLRGRGIAVTMRTPGHDEELAAGFLLTEAIIRKRSDIVAMSPCLQSDSPENTLNVFLAPALKVDLKRLTRHVFASSSCGLCGKASIEAVRQQFPPVDARIKVPLRVLKQLVPAMRAAQSTFNETGGLHAAAVFESSGQLIALREDIGRHNAVDKVLGYGFLNGKFPLDAHLLLVSGRTSFEIMQKALAARIPIVCSISAPSSLAVEFARDSGQTLIGFLRDQSFNVYAGAERISCGGN